MKKKIVKPPAKKKKLPFRPTKLTDRFITAAKEVISEDLNAIIMTDEELLMLINAKLPEEAQVADTTWKEWKAGTAPVKQIEHLEAFRLLVKNALTKQKAHLFTKMQYDDKAWQRWAWIIERKFDDWNIRQKVDGNVKSEVTVVGFTYLPPGKSPDGQDNPGN